MTQRAKKSWKDDLGKTRYVMDVWLLIGFVLVCVPQTTGIPIHEWISLVFIVPLVIHILLHWEWIKSVPSKFFARFSGESKFNAVWDVIFYLAMVMVTLSGFLVSEAMLPQLGIPLVIQPFWSEIHHSLGNMLMPMLGIHLALHWTWIKNMTKKLRQSNSKKANGEAAQ